MAYSFAENRRRVFALFEAFLYDFLLVNGKKHTHTHTHTQNFEGESVNN